MPSPDAIASGQTQSAIDFAQLTDGLRAEREQGITIDVAYRYFSTQRRKFIIADTPGHEQYTRNMATGASTADLAIILIDARKGILTQSRRHAYIASLLGIRHLVAAVNKMDLVDFSEEVFRQIEADFASPGQTIRHSQISSPSLSARSTATTSSSRSSHTPWYDGPTLLEHLEQCSRRHLDTNKAFRLPVQRVIRPDQHLSRFCRTDRRRHDSQGDEIVALPSGRTQSSSHRSPPSMAIWTEAAAPQSIAITLEEELDISRGDVLADPAHPPKISTEFEAALVWFDGARLEDHKPYLLKHGTQTLNARITRVLHRTNIQTLEYEAVHSLGMNDIGVVEIATTRPIFFDAYADNRATGSFILIDPATNATAAAGMIRRSLSDDAASAEPNHHASLLLVPDTEQASHVEQLLLSQGLAVVRTRVGSKRLWQALLRIGVVVLLEGHTPEAARQLAEDLPIEVPNTSTRTPQEFLQELQERKVLPPQKGSQQ